MSDLDIVNCHPNILYYICKKNDISKEVDPSLNTAELGGIRIINTAELGGIRIINTAELGGIRSAAKGLSGE